MITHNYLNGNILITTNRGEKINNHIITVKTASVTVPPARPLPNPQLFIALHSQGNVHLRPFHCGFQ